MWKWLIWLQSMRWLLRIGNLAMGPMEFVFMLSNDQWVMHQNINSRQRKMKACGCFSWRFPSSGPLFCFSRWSHLDSPHFRDVARFVPHCLPDSSPCAIFLLPTLSPKPCTIFPFPLCNYHSAIAQKKNLSLCNQGHVCLVFNKIYKKKNMKNLKKFYTNANTFYTNFNNFQKKLKQLFKKKKF